MIAGLLVDNGAMSLSHPFVMAALGGVVIGLGASLLLLFNGRVAGVSGIAGGLFTSKPGDRGWRVAFLAGLVAGGMGLAFAWPQSFGAQLPGGTTVGVLVLAGLLVGFGTQLGTGCTSGHGVCGISRGSVRSIAATLMFMATGAGAAYVARHLLGAQS